MTFLKELILIRQVNQKFATFLTIGIFLNKGFKFQPNVCNECHDLVMTSMNFSNIAILNIKGSDYRCIIRGNSKNEAKNIMQNADSTKKNGTLSNTKIYYLI